MCTQKLRNMQYEVFFIFPFHTDSLAPYLLQIFDPKNHRYEPPYPEVPDVRKAASHTDYRIVIDPSRQGFKVMRKRTNTTM